MSKLVIVGGSKGIGHAILAKLYSKYDQVVLFDIASPIKNFPNVIYKRIDLSKDNPSICENDICSADTLIISAGIGQIKPFENTDVVEIKKTFNVNAVSPIIFIKYFYKQLLNREDAKCLVFSSIAGEISSPLFATYGSSKASVTKICESLNVELMKNNSRNRITCVEATSFEGTSFYGGETDISKLNTIAEECIYAMESKEMVHFINNELCKDIINRYNNDKVTFGESSFDYKMKSGRINKKRNIIIGYLSGTFDLFHIGHLNLLRRAKEQCDYLIVGVHKSGAWKGKETFIPFEERLEIIRSIRFVDEAYESFEEDSDAWNKYHYDKLFVGSDYKGSDRFKKYEEFFKDKGVEIIYFPYTNGTSSTQLRDKISKK